MFHEKRDWEQIERSFNVNPFHFVRDIILSSLSVSIVLPNHLNSDDNNQNGSNSILLLLFFMDS